MNARQRAYAALPVSKHFTAECLKCGWILADDKSNFGEHDERPCE